MGWIARWAGVLKWPLAVALAAAATALISFGVRGEDGDFGGGRGAGSSKEASRQVTGIVRRLSLTRRAEGVMLVGFRGTDATAPVFGRLETEGLGGVFVGERNWSDPVQGAALVGELRAAARTRRVPPLVVTSQEGGSYRALDGIGPARSQAELGVTRSVRSARQWAFRSASELGATGFDLNLGLVADVAPIDSAISDRSFGDDGATVARLVTGAVKGCRAAGMLCGLRHFPGQGAASADTDEEPATVGLGEAELEQRDLASFRAGIRAGARVVILSHSLFGAFDPVTPASLSPEVANDLLRDRIRFGGVAITDDLSAGAIRSGREVPDAAVKALAAGADMVLVGSPGPVQRRIRDAIVHAVRSGSIPEQRLNEALIRVLELKQGRGLLSR